jgi:Zn finger protein HypA/HybF involved in hydrogenase expression
MAHSDESLTELLIYRCERCGDVFPLHEDQQLRCPTCGSDEVHLASEPLL